jgi:hypothetical protein
MIGYEAGSPDILAEYEMASVPFTRYSPWLIVMT